MNHPTLFRVHNNLRLRPLRPRQTQAIADIRQAIKDGHKRIILQAPCGFGKTLTAAWLIGGSLSKGTRPLFTAPAISLIDQTVKAFEFEGIRDIGVMQAQHARTDRGAQVQIASVATLIKRELPDVDFLMLDEIHRSFKGLNEMLDGPWKDKIAIGLTATPWCKGMGLRWTSLIIPATIPQLIEEELLTPTILYVPEQIADRGNIAVQKGEFTEASASQEMRKDRIVGNVVETWKKLGPGDKTFMFCVNLDHARAQMAAFIDAGVPFGYIDAQTPNEERTLQFRKMQHGEIAGIASVGCLDEETEILTSSGWVGIDDITVTHRIAAWWQSFVEFTNPLGIIKGKRKAEEQMASLRATNVDIRVTDDHRMLWSATRGGEFSFRLAKDVVGKKGFIPVTGTAEPARFTIKQDHPEKERSRKHTQVYAYMKRGKTKGEAKEMACDFRERNSVISSLKSPESLTLCDCRLIGFWLGDGTRVGGRITLSQSVANAGIVKWVDALLSVMSVDVERRVVPPSGTRTMDTVVWNLPWGRGGCSQERRGVSYLDDYFDKGGSVLYWGLSQEQILALLDGFRMADGNHGKDSNGSGRGKQIYGAYRPIFDHLQAICSVRGIRTGLSHKKCRETTMYVFSYRVADMHEVSVNRFQLEVPKSERIWCVESTTGAIITRRHGKVSVVGNCLIAGVDEDVRCIIDAAPTKSEISLVQRWGRGIRTHVGKAALIGLDHAGNNTDQGLGLFWEIFHDHLDTHKPNEKGVAYEGEKRPAKPRKCAACNVLIPAGSAACKNCGQPVKATGIEHEEGELVVYGTQPKDHELSAAVAFLESKGMTFGGEFGYDNAIEKAVKLGFVRKGKKREYTMQEKQDWYSGFLWMVRERGKNEGAAAHRYKEKFGVWPAKLLKVPRPPSFEVEQFDRHCRIKYAKSKAKESECKPPMTNAS